MSEKNLTPETPKSSKFVTKLNSLKPSNIDNEKKEAVIRRIKFATAYTAAFAAGVLTTVAVINGKSIFADAMNDEADEVEENENSED